MHLVIMQAGIDDDIIVVAGDNLFSRPLEGFSEFCRAHNAPVLGVYDVGNLEEIKKYNAIETDATSRITFFEEKPKEPKSTITGSLYTIIQLSFGRQQYIGEQHRTPGLLIHGLTTHAGYVWRVP